MGKWPAAFFLGHVGCVCLRCGVATRLIAGTGAQLSYTGIEPAVGGSRTKTVHYLLHLPCVHCARARPVLTSQLEVKFKFKMTLAKATEIGFWCIILPFSSSMGVK